MDGLVELRHRDLIAKIILGAVLWRRDYSDYYVVKVVS